MQDYLYELATDKYKGFLATTLKVILFILSLIYGLIVRILIFFYQLLPYRLNCKVISIGNITLGGTGKTSLVEYIAGYLRQEGHKVAVLSRGYKRSVVRRKETIPESECGIRDTEYGKMGDESYMLSKNLGDVPILVDANRIRAAHLAIRDYGVDTVILDDGFQQWRIIKDLEIVTIDATNPFGNRHLIPRGILREPLSSLKRADIFVLTKINLNKEVDNIKNVLNKFNPKGIIIESIHQPQGFYHINKPQETFAVDYLKGKTVTLFSGIGSPASFESLITNLGIKIGLSFRFTDHHNYTKEDLDKIINNSRDKNIDTIITTEKDAARISQLSVVPATDISGSAKYFGGSCQLSVFVFRIEFKIKDEKRFCDRLLELYSL